MMPLVFVVDGSIERRSVVQYTLERAGYAVQTFATTRVLEIAERQHPGVMIISIDLPDGNGSDLCGEIKSNTRLSNTKVILLAENKIGKYRALVESNADDCISTPFAPGELTCSVEGVLHRAMQASSFTSDKDDIVINSAAMKVMVRGSQITTTTLEFRLIDFMARHRGKVFSRDALLDAVWGDLQFVTPRSVDACVRRIRKKIEHDCSSPTYLKTVRGIGYKLDARTTWEKASNELCNCAICSALRTRTKSSTAASHRDEASGAAAQYRVASFR
jgi:two-component system alkaline phosphatase synthesis response regulator PhoP